MNKKRFEALKWASSFLASHQKDENAGEILLQHRLQLSRTGLLSDLQSPLTAEDWDWFFEKVKEHAVQGKPVQHITGEEVFYGRSFKVNSYVLIPRPETEEVVLAALEQMKTYFDEDPITIADIGTGSGIIAITIAKERAGAAVTAVDISSEALKVAKENAEQLDAAVRFVEGSVLDPFLNKETFDVIVSNPPYISRAEMEGLKDVVKGHDPHLALTDHADGLSFYRKIISALPEVMKDRLLVIFEIGHTQGEAVTKLFRNHFPAAELKVIKDISGKDRIVSAWLDRSEAKYVKN